MTLRHLSASQQYCSVTTTNTLTLHDSHPRCDEILSFATVVHGKVKEKNCRRKSTVFAIEGILEYPADW